MNKEKIEITKVEMKILKIRIKDLKNTYSVGAGVVIDGEQLWIVQILEFNNEWISLLVKDNFTKK